MKPQTLDPGPTSEGDEARICGMRGPGAGLEGSMRGTAVTAVLMFMKFCTSVCLGAV